MPPVKVMFPGFGSAGSCADAGAAAVTIIRATTAGRL